MEKEYWFESWKIGRTGFNQTAPNKLLKDFGEKYFSNIEAVFVPLAGKSIDMLWFYERQISVIGVELVETACREFFEEHNIPYKKNKEGKFQVFRSDDGKITLFNGDFFELTPKQLPENIGGIYDRACLVAFPPQMRKQFARKIFSLFPRKLPTYFLITFEFPSTEGPPFSVPEEEVRELFGKKYRMELLCSENMEVKNKEVLRKGYVLFP